ncbi:MAG TPA: Uma2 family endonuclease [Pyrinomonadaceae bacterium]|jgi:Uma2 family endonuclease|nr:Uma2 family endonuclease [Pyrinomonadaceae bacterium]
MSSQPKTYLTPAEYLAIERKAEYKSEYIDGVMVGMTGASREHNLIVFNLAGLINPQLKGQPCEGYVNDMRVRTPSTRPYTYPDVVVVRGEPQFEDETFDTLLNPTVIIEVLSDSTELYDRGKKFGFYRTIDSLAEYLLVAQNESRIEHYARQADGRWLLADYRAPEESVELASIQCRLTLGEVYDKVAFPDPPADESLED